MENFIFPDWDNNILNISASLAEYLGVECSKYTKLQVLQNELKKEYKNVAFILLDGMGYNLLNRHLDSSKLLTKNIVKKLTSTFPSTTTNATTSLATLTYPGEHNWLGWCLYFDDFNRSIDLFLNKDSDTEEVVENFDTYSYMPTTNYFERERTRKDIDIYTVCPPYFRQKYDLHALSYTSLDEMFTNLDIALKIDSKKFIYCYCNNPDHTMHDFGASSSEANSMLSYLNEKIEQLINDNEDTLLVITADHGHIDAKGQIEFYSDEKLNSLLTRPLTLDARSISFSVKEGKKEEFEREFSKYEKYFTLFSTQYLLDKNVFGPYTEKTKNFLGDYIAVGKENNYVGLMRENYPIMNGHHTSLTEEEMYVPLILVKNKKD